MKLRTARVHHMGSSNRELESFGHETKNVFENSYIKSQSCYYKTAQSLPSSQVKESKAKNPYQGTHLEQETLRWNSKSKNIGTETQWKLESPAKRLDYTGFLNNEVGNLAE
jgi:hypothetical protein